MTRQEFIDEAKEYGYDSEGIKELLEIYDEMHQMDENYSYDNMYLVPQLKY